ncbi:hypothetical protein RRG08_024058 [Elysia crispata]|uniref:G-protein coupled receptors family 1 profile domain-containing protein n=1 Tax=Elysia crispata TaxID=231223 RepID=A0AAE1DKM3_9GAST|nr:hypothetical protein RRG08_024058 [Elysia crispata]
MEERYFNETQRNNELIPVRHGGWNLVTMTWLDLESVLIYTLVPSMTFSLLGIVTNVLNIAVFTRMGLHETTTISMLALAVSDLICCILTSWVVLCYIPAFRDLPSLPFISTEVATALGGSFKVYVTRTGGMLTALITVERCLCVVAPLKVKRIITLSVTRAIVIVVFAITVLPSFAYVFWDILTWKFYPHLNKTLIGVVHNDQPVVTLVNQINGFVCGFGYLFISSLIIFVCTIFLITVLLRSHKWRGNFNSQDKSTDQKSAGSTKEIKLIRMVTAIATIFILGMLPGMSVLCGTAILPEKFSLRGPFAPFYVFCTSLATITEATNSSINFFVYFTMGTKFKSTFHRFIGLEKKAEKNSKAN